MQTFVDATLDAAAVTKNGVVYENVSGANVLRLGRQGATFKPGPAAPAPATGTNLGTPDLVVRTAVADFNGDGQIDYVGGLADGTTKVYRNFSADNRDPLDTGDPNAPPWNDPNYFLAPKFLPSTVLSTSGFARMILAAGDFNGDGRPDIVRFNAQNAGANLAQSIHVFLNTGNNGSGDPQFPSFYTGNFAAADLTKLQTMPMPGRNTSVVVVDYNNDRKLDILISSTLGTGGTIHRFRNECTLLVPPPAVPPPTPLPCTNNPRFSYDGDLIADLNAGTSLPTFAYEDFDGDGARDLVVGSPDCCVSVANSLRMYKGQLAPPGTINTTSFDSLEFPGDAVVMLAEDFSRDGKIDLIVGTDGDAGPVAGGQGFYYKNNGTGQPLLDPTTPTVYPTAKIVSNGSPLIDFDIGMAFNYDNDPLGTVDLILGTDSALTNYKLFSNRSGILFNNTSDVISGALDLGPLATTEMVVTTGRLRPTVNLNGGTVQWSMSNLTIDPVVFTPAVTCPDNAAELCVTFPRPMGREIRWKAELTSDPTQTLSPEVVRVDVKFDYTRATEHYQAGVVAQDGVAYVGAFRVPGQRGKLYAVSGDLGQTYWEAGAVLDAMNDNERHIYTVAADGTTRLDFLFGVSGTNDTGLFAMGVYGAIVDWARSARFGVGNTGIPPTKLGSIETSTPAVIGKPGLAPWYVFADATERAAIDSFVAAQSNRVPVVLFGSKDGMIHAIRNDPTLIADARNGREAWAVIPHPVAVTMLSDFIDNATTDPPDLLITGYPDGSPSVADVKIGVSMRTVAVVGSGGGGTSFSAFDITETIDPSGPTVFGPTPLWYKTPLDAGAATAKPAIIRVSIGGVERHIVVVGTGLDATETAPPYTKGRWVEAYDIAAGAGDPPLWRAKTACPVTSNIVAFETDDDNGITPPPPLDGYIDRVVFADKCGYIYQVDPGQDLSGGIMSNTGLGAIPALPAPADPDQLIALFSTADTANGVDGSVAGDPTTSEERPIVGTIAARTDVTGDMVLFFGTGGLTEFDTRYHNEFFAIYAKNGVVRSKLIGGCNGGPRACEKFYGGVTITAEQVIMARTIDPLVGTGTCDDGSTVVQGVKVNANPAIDPTVDVDNFLDALPAQTLDSAAVSKSLYARGGAIYLSVQSGQIIQIGQTNAATAGAETASGSRAGMGQGQGGNIGTDKALTLMAWRQIF